MRSHFLNQRVRGDAMGDDAEEDGPAGREHYRVVSGQLFVKDENSKNDCG
jgi:hypothetical protein